MMDVGFDYDTILDIDAYLRTSPRERPLEPGKPLTHVNGDNSKNSSSAGAASGKPEGGRRVTRRPFTVITDDTLQESTAAQPMRQQRAFGSPTYDDGNNVSSANNSTTKNGSSAHYTTAPNTTVRRRREEEEEVRLPTIVSASANTNHKLLRPHDNSHSTPLGRVPPASQADRSKSYDNSSNSHNNPSHPAYAGRKGGTHSSAATPLTTATGTAFSPAGNGNANGGRKLSTAPNGRVSPLKVNVCTATNSAGAQRYQPSDAANQYALNGWVDACVKSFEGNASKTTPKTSKDRLATTTTPLGTASTTNGETKRSTAGSEKYDKVRTSDWADGGYDLGSPFDSCFLGGDATGAGKATDEGGAKNKGPAVASGKNTSGDPSSANAHQFPSSPPNYAPSPATVAAEREKRTGTEGGSSAKTPTPQRPPLPPTTSTTGVARPPLRIHVNGAGDIKDGEFTLMPKADAVNKNGKGVSSRVALQQQQQSQASSGEGGNVPAWRMPQGPKSKENGSPVTAVNKGSTETKPSSGAAAHPTAAPNTFTVTATSTAKPTLSRTPSNQPATDPPGTANSSNAPTPLHNRRIRLEATNTSQLPSVFGSFMSRPTTSRATAIFKESPNAGALSAEMEAILMSSQWQEKLHQLQVWQANFRLLNRDPHQVVEPSVVRKAPECFQRFPLSSSAKEPEVAGEEVEMNDGLHGMDALIRAPLRPRCDKCPFPLPCLLKPIKAKRRPQTPRSFYGPVRKHVGRDWFRNSLAGATEVPSPNLASLDVMDGDGRHRGGIRR